MAKMKASEIMKMASEERKKKLEELKMEMIRARVAAAKTGSSKIKQIKKLVARILTAEKNHSMGEKNKMKNRKFFKIQNREDFA